MRGVILFVWFLVLCGAIVHFSVISFLFLLRGAVFIFNFFFLVLFCAVWCFNLVCFFFFILFLFFFCAVWCYILVLFSRYFLFIFLRGVVFYFYFLPLSWTSKWARLFNKTPHSLFLHIFFNSVEFFERAELAALQP